MFDTWLNLGDGVTQEYRREAAEAPAEAYGIPLIVDRAHKRGTAVIDTRDQDWRVAHSFAIIYCTLDQGMGYGK